jgi:cytoskeletal protein RodZ
MGIGELLRSEREKKGLSLSDVENATKIRTKYIQAMETERFEIIPGEVYRLGFLKNYARLLDLDPEAMIVRYKSAYKDASHDEDREGARQAVANARRSVRNVDRADGQQAGAVAWRPVMDWVGKLAQAGSIFKNRRLLLGAAAAVVVLILIVAGVDLFRYTLLAANQPPPQPSKPPTVPSAVYSQPQTLEIRLVGIGHCWAEVKVDGADAYAGTIKPGDVKTFTAQSSVWVDLGYPKSVDVFYNGAELPPLGTTTPVTRTFTDGHPL